MEMNKDMKPHGALEPVTLPAAAVTQLFYDVQMLAMMHKRLIQMYEIESELKKQHKAYLHVRERAEEICEFDKMAVASILDHYENPKKYRKETICFHNYVNGIAEESCEGCKGCEGEEKACMNHDEEVKEEEKKLDVFNLPHDMVMMSMNTLHVMQDDMIALTTVVDALVDAFVKIEEGGGYNHTEMHHLTASAAEVARDVFNRWDDAELTELG